jgi:ABC-2 type transport system ATP-binding protein
VIEVVALGSLIWWANRQWQSRRARRHSSEAGSRSADRSERREALLVGSPVDDAALELVGVHKRYRTTQALDGLDIAVPHGCVFGLLGPNGSGKTTALRCALGLIRPTSGQCRVFGVDSPHRLHEVIGRVGALIEAPGLVPTFTGRQNLALLAALVDGAGPDRVERELARVGLSERADDPVHTYSLGMRQRLGIGAALLRDPELVVLDEPTNGLDPAGIAEMRTLVRSLGAEGRTVLLSSHLLDEVEKTCDRIAIVDRGRCIASGPVPDVLATATGTSTVLVRLADLGAGQAVLQAHGIDAEVVETDALSVHWPALDAAHVSEILAGARLFPSELRPQRATIEELFLRLTGDGTEPAEPTEPTEPTSEAWR